MTNADEKNARPLAVEAEYKCCLHKLTRTANDDRQVFLGLGLPRIQLACEEHGEEGDQHQLPGGGHDG